MLAHRAAVELSIVRSTPACRRASSKIPCALRTRQVSVSRFPTGVTKLAGQFKTSTYGSPWDPLEVLDLPPTATLSEVRLAYYRRARSVHPDFRTNESGSDREAKFAKTKGETVAVANGADATTADATAVTTAAAVEKFVNYTTAFEKLVALKWQQPVEVKLVASELALSFSSNNASRAEQRKFKGATSSHRDENWLARRRLEPIATTSNALNTTGGGCMTAADSAAVYKYAAPTTTVPMSLPRALEVWHNNLQDWGVLGACYEDYTKLLGEEVQAMVKAAKSKHSPRPALAYLCKQPLLAVTVVVVPLPVLAAFSSPSLLVGVLWTGSWLIDRVRGAGRFVLHRMVQPVPVFGPIFSGVLQRGTSFWAAIKQFCAKRFRSVFKVDPRPSELVWLALVKAQLTHNYVNRALIEAEESS